MVYLIIAVFFVISFIYFGIMNGYVEKNDASIIPSKPMSFAGIMMPGIVLSAVSGLSVFAWKMIGSSAHFSDWQIYGLVFLIFVSGIIMYSDVRWQLVYEPFYVLTGLVGLNISPVGSVSDHAEAALCMAVLLWGLYFFQRLCGKRGSLGGSDIIMGISASMWLAPSSVLAEQVIGMAVCCLILVFLVRRAEDGHQAMAPAIFVPLLLIVLLPLFDPTHQMARILWQP